MQCIVARLILYYLPKRFLYEQAVEWYDSLLHSKRWKLSDSKLSAIWTHLKRDLVEYLKIICPKCEQISNNVLGWKTQNIFCLASTAVGIGISGMFNNSKCPNRAYYTDECWLYIIIKLCTGFLFHLFRSKLCQLICIRRQGLFIFPWDSSREYQLWKSKSYYFCVQLNNIV